MCSCIEPGRRNRRSRVNHRRGERRGIVLIFVVAVLVLLAVIATTYLSMARMDRVPTEIKGGLPGGDSPPSLPLPIGEITLDPYGWTTQNASTWFYRPVEGKTTFTNYLDTDFLDDRNLYGLSGTIANELAPTVTDLHTRLQHDPWLASRAPELLGGTTPAWPKISRWIELWTPDDPKTPLVDESVWTFSGPTASRIGEFESPFNPAVSTATVGWVPTPENYRRTDSAIPSYIRIEYGSYPGTPFKSPSDYNQKVAIYPAFKFPGDPKQYLAADADGDGVADSGLFSLNWFAEAAAGVIGTDRPFQDSLIPAGFYSPTDPQHPTRWYAAVRIVDAGGAINVNTAWRRDADLPLTAGGGGAADKYDAPLGTLPTGAVPNYGFFRSNIGFYELLAGQDKDTAQWPRFTANRLGFDLNNPGSVAALTSATGRGDYAFSTIGEALEMNLARRPVTPGGAPAYRSFPASLSSSLAYLNGMINPRVGRSDLETTLFADLYRNVPNWAAADLNDTDKETRSFTFFAPPSTVLAPTNAAPPADTFPPLLWWNSTYNPDDATRNSYFATIGAYGGGVNTPARTRRHLLTTANPQSTASRNLDANPAWLLTPSVGVEMEKLPGTNDARPKASINTDNFGTLWRQFYMAMAAPNYAGNYATAAGGSDLDAPGHAVALSAEQALYLRSAIAAVNAIDMRDTDDDVTTKRIELPAVPAGALARSVMVAGCEKQLFVKKVEIATDIAGTQVFRITVTNPYATVNGATNFDIVTAGYYVGLLPTGGGSYSDVKSFPSLSVPNPIVSNADAIFDLPIPVAGSGEIVLLRRRNADGSASNGVVDPVKNPYTEPTGTTNYDQLVCVDIVRVGDYATAASSGVTYTRNPTDWMLASTGTDLTLSLTNTGAVANPVAIDNLPPGVTKAATGMANKFPFGAFPRLGDLMTIPYVGHYAIYSVHSATATLLDAVPVTLDVQQVHKATPVALPQITGRFMPIATAPASYSADWRSRIFDYFTVLGNPMSDYLPNMAPDSWLYKNGIASATPPAEIKDNDPAVQDYLSPVQGLININTADVDVMNMLPLVTKADNSGTIDPVANKAAADAIIAYRRANGPFKSVMDVLNVIPTTATPSFPQMVSNPADGNFFLAGPMKTYQNKYHSFIRISNLATTRSDAFVMYILLQQWQDYGSDHPLLLPNTEQRLTVLIDRSQLRSGVGGPLGQVLTQTSASN